MSKLFFFDIDGTLIECNKDIYSIQESTRNALSQLQDQGDDVFLATGRCKCFILDGVMDYPFSGYVTCNGAYVEYKGKSVYKKIISAEAIKKTHELCKERNMAYYFEGNDHIYILNKTNPKHIEFKDNWGMKEEVIVDQFDVNSIETYIGMIVVNSKDDIQPMVERLSPYFDIQRHQSEFSFDLTLKGESKAKGIEKLVEALGKDMKDTIAFGDGRNDIEMLSHVGLSIAMGNAAIEAKEVAQYVTDDVDKDGIVKALHHFSLI
ncbi:Cof-type HAD-IIB family hydrolase [Candidatus Stoquefichus massiliensis]|uniref:Cof-type HAD-IIB family hydrolase n=1 Tax=Candidatus Stoquefichus massiliensis TaxID=1470350 RepID=UPI000481432C|nr:Cof-type HAD-IIB family hydrolase [Candidatus Stoquefichus massiliensis]